MVKQYAKTCYKKTKEFNVIRENGLTILRVLFVTSLIIANVIAGKVVDLWGLIIPAAFVTYGFTFLFTDLISEFYGKKEAIKTVWFGFGATIFAAGLIFLGQLMPSAVFAKEAGDAYNIILGMNYRFVVASMTAYLIAQNIDVFLFHFWKKLTGGKYKWIRNNFSTMISQFVDTAIFITIAFFGSVPALGVMIVSQYIGKLFIAAIDTPVFYLLTREKK